MKILTIKNAIKKNVLIYEFTNGLNKKVYSSTRDTAFIAPVACSNKSNFKYRLMYEKDKVTKRTYINKKIYWIFEPRNKFFTSKKDVFEFAEKNGYTNIVGPLKGLTASYVMLKRTT